MEGGRERERERERERGGGGGGGEICFVDLLSVHLSMLPPFPVPPLMGPGAAWMAEASSCMLAVGSIGSIPSSCPLKSEFHSVALAPLLSSETEMEREKERDREREREKDREGGREGGRDGGEGERETLLSFLEALKLVQYSETSNHTPKRVSRTRSTVLEGRSELHALSTRTLASGHALTHQTGPSRGSC